MSEADATADAETPAPRGPRWTLERAASEAGPPFHPFAGANFRTFLRHYFQTGGHFSRRSRLQRLSAWSVQIFRWPFAAFETAWWGRRIREHRPAHPPIFVIGHWRSGTTHLHNLLSKDPQFGWIDFGETAMPWDMLGEKVRIGRGILNRVLPKDRGYDNVKLSLEEPQEEEMALGNMNPLCYYNCYYFPREMRRHSRRALFFEDLDAAEMAQFERAYSYLLQKLSYAKGGRQLLLKNPASTTRIPLLKRLFPDAKFIHISRNPWPVFRSSVKKFSRLFNAFAWQDFDASLDLPGFVLETYADLVRRYLRDREILAPGDLCETSFESIVADPLGEIGRIYDRLGIEGRDRALSQIGRYVTDIRDYERNVHRVDAEHAAAIRDRWAFAFEAFGYPLDPPAEIDVVEGLENRQG